MKSRPPSEVLGGAGAVGDSFSRRLFGWEAVEGPGAVGGGTCLSSVRRGSGLDCEEGYALGSGEVLGIPSGRPGPELKGISWMGAGGGAGGGGGKDGL